MYLLIFRNPYMNFINFYIYEKTFLENKLKL